MNVRALTALPVYNEEKHILGVLDEVRKFSDEILVVDDGSSDKTAELLASQTDIQVLTHEKNSGYGAALWSSFQFAIEQDYDVLVTIDCDGQHEPKLIPELIQQIDSPDDQPIDLVSGSRYLQVFSGDSVPPEERRKVNVQITDLINERLGFELTDAFCGFKAYRVDALKKFDITEFGYAMPLQLWVQAAAADFNIQEFPVPLIYLDEERSFGGSLDDAKKRLAYYERVLNREIEASSLSCSQISETGCQAS